MPTVEKWNIVKLWLKYKYILHFGVLWTRRDRDSVKMIRRVSQQFDVEEKKKKKCLLAYMKKQMQSLTEDI